MKPTAALFAIIIISVLSVTDCFACSMCKLTINGHTYVGNNEDSWRLGSRIWFETSKPGKLGCVYVGYSDHPQGGMNEAGLAFDGFATIPKPIRNNTGKKEISSATGFLKEIMQRFSTVEEVKRFAIQYNRQKFFNNGELMFVDRAGNYLVMEADTMTTGNDERYLMANFFPSVDPEEQRLKLDRYRKGRLFLNNHAADTSADLCFALTDTMHECSPKLGDGTVYSYIADLDKGDFTLCFYHDFKHPIKFNLHEELAKGDHVLPMTSLFPNNTEYARFINFKTPRNNTTMLLFLFVSGGLFAFSALYFLFRFFVLRRKQAGTKRSVNVRLLLAVLSVILLYYMSVLYKDEGVYYAAEPMNITAYIPFLLLILVVPLLLMITKIFRDPSWGVFSKGVFLLNNLFYLALIGLFFYWGMYVVV